jgi:hypothetical protein
MAGRHTRPQAKGTIDMHPRTGGTRNRRKQVKAIKAAVALK